MVINSAPPPSPSVSGLLSYRRAPPGCVERDRDGVDPAGAHQSPRPLRHHHLRNHRPGDVHGGHAQG